MNHLQLCPNCGGTPRLHKKKGSGRQFWYECDGDCWTQTSKCSTEEEAAAKWNAIKPTVHEEDPMRKITFEEYLEAIDPADPPPVRDRIIHDAYNDADIDCLQFKQLYQKAYPEMC